MKHFLLIIICLLGINSYVQSQNKQNYLSGYQNEINGTKFTYHSPFSYSEASLLSRARQEFSPIEWETEPIPIHFSDKKVSFCWMYGIDVTPTPQTFNLFLDGEKTLSFSSPTNTQTKVWKVQGENGAELSFNQSMVDKYGDQMGFAILTIPSTLVNPGKPIRIKIDGVNNKSDNWYMTFKTPLKETITAKQLQTITKKDGQLFHTIRFDIIHLDAEADASIITKKTHKNFTLQTGLNEIDLLVPATDKPQNISAVLKISNEIKQQLNIEVSPVKKWTINLVQHSHTDIGYTRPQSEILAEHLRYIDLALDYCDQTDSLPDNSKFRWTCEAAWTVREYLNNRPEHQVNRLLKRIKEGRIEVTAMFFNFSEIVDESALAKQIQTLKAFKDHDIDVTTAMQNDVNGIAWGLIDLYKNTGVKYLIMGQHGHRARIPFNKPTSFWWESPSGNKLLAYRSEHYMHGNSLGLTSGDMNIFRDNLSDYLENLEEKNYPFDHTAFQFSGYITDNSPPSIKACDIVEKWNKKYLWPKLRLSVASEFMSYIEKNESNHLETEKVAWPDWWTDGFGSAMNETKISRNTHAEMIANQGLLSMAAVLGSSIPDELLADIDKCYENLLFYDEHTFGAAESISDPATENSINQWSQKSSYVWSAFQQSGLIKEKALGILEPFLKKDKLPTITVFNTLNWKRNGLVKVFIVHDFLPLDKEFKILDENGKNIPAQIISSRSEGSYWALFVKDIPPMGTSTLKIKVLEDELVTKNHNANIQSQTIENEFYKLEIDKNKGAVISIFDKILNKELVDPHSQEKLGRFIYEQPDNRQALERLTNLNRDTTYTPLVKKISYLSDIRITKIVDGAIWKSIYMTGKMPICADDKGVTMEIRLYNQSKKIELLYNMRKLANTSPEGVYIAFPFKMSNNDQLAFDVQGGTVYPGKNQLEGTASDWNTVQNFVSVSNNNGQIVFSGNDIPLVQFGDINTGRYYYKHIPQKSHFYSWVLNNYWTTNFKASQEGELKWHYYLTSSSDNSNAFAIKFGWENRIPLVARALSSSNKNNPGLEAKSIIDIDTPSNLLLIVAQPTNDGHGVLLQLRETEGQNTVLNLNKLHNQPNIKHITETNVLGNQLHKLGNSISFKPFETKFILLNLIP